MSDIRIRPDALWLGFVVTVFVLNLVAFFVGVVDGRWAALTSLACAAWLAWKTQELIRSLRSNHGHRRDQAGGAGGAGALQNAFRGAQGAVAPARAYRAVETQATEIVAWRAWALVGDGGEWYLRSFYFPEGNPLRWEGPAVRADEVPTLEGRHGIYALTAERFNQPSSPYGDSLMATMYGSPVMDDGKYKHEGFVYGEVALSGLVLEGTHGFRAEQAVVRSLVVKLRAAWRFPGVVPIQIAASLESRYQCPVTIDVSGVVA